MAGEVAWWVSAIIGAASAGSVKLAENFISWKFDKRRSTERQRDEDVLLVEKVVFEIRDLAKEYWASEGRDQSAEGAISGRLLFVGSTIDELLAANDQLLRNAQMALNRFDVACSGGQFGSANRQPEPSRSSAIESSAYTLIHHVSKGRRGL